jgi:hypothetical protein
MFHLVGMENGRILAYIDPWAYYDSYGYQPIHSLFALGSGGVFGMGLGQARQKFQWLPQAHTDSIFAIVGEELGLIGTLLVLMGFLLVAYRGYRIACRTTDPFASLVAIGITSWLTFQAMLNIAVTTSLVPFTGLTLPFISYGSTSLIMCMVSTGILLNISRYAEAPRPVVAPDVPVMHRSPALELFQATRQAMNALPPWNRRRTTAGQTRRTPSQPGISQPGAKRRSSMARPSIGLEMRHAAHSIKTLVMGSVQRKPARQRPAARQTEIQQTGGRPNGSARKQRPASKHSSVLGYIPFIWQVVVSLRERRRHRGTRLPGAGSRRQPQQQHSRPAARQRRTPSPDQR